MGIPKFFRYISERYPLISQLIEQDKIPEFDNFYLDFNGIIHNCSHPNDGDAHYRISEEQIFTAIFTYVDFLFGKIKPKKLFFMAIDGVAPRAKMNQQRSRRFRTAKEAREVREKAISKGEKLPEEKAFDSNAITPGTPFMARLNEQLRYFIHKKISEDANWRDIQVILSGHDVPGEGEHKIMEYIRHAKAQPGYNPNVRHCLYGLDADLIMLGLLSHDPHFCLMREEVKFGPAAKKRNNGSLESQSFFLLHLSLLREYLDLEFHSIAMTLPFTYNLERIIDDFITLAVFVGNDFLPHLPDLHIHENALERLFDIYKMVLSDMGGYLNDGGVIDMSRLQKIMNEMRGVEKEAFEKETSDTSWFRGKQRKYADKPDKARKNTGLTSGQNKIFKRVEEWVLANRDVPIEAKRTARLSFVNDLSAGDKRFISNLAIELHLETAWDEYDDQDQNLIVLRLPVALVDSEDEEGDGEAAEEWEDVDDEESKAAIDRVLRKYNQANVLEDDDWDDRYEAALQQKMNEWKVQYYKEKFEFPTGESDSKEVRDLVFRYCEGLQWVMYYYYSGVASWGWFYDYHYAPRISDLRDVDEFKFDFELGQPFRPFEQLMGVLPEASRELVPAPYRHLMSDPNSPLIDFYPQEFVQDMNGKKQEWEAVVKIPFIDASRLLSAMGQYESQLSEDERIRNSRGPSRIFTFKEELQPKYLSPLPVFFPDILRCFCVMEEYHLPTLDGLHPVQGLCDGVQLGADALAGFPSLKTLRHTGQLGYHNVNVFNADSRNKSIVIHIDNAYENNSPEQLARQMLGKRAFFGWPFLKEGLVVGISSSQIKFTKPADNVVVTRHTLEASSLWRRKVERLTSLYSKRYGVIVGDVDILLHARPLKGMSRTETGALVKEYEDNEIEQAIQMMLTQVVSEDPRFVEKEPPPISEEFPDGTRVFFLGEHAYGVAAQVAETTPTTLSIMLAFLPAEANETEKFKQVLANRVATRYFPSWIIAEKANLNPYALSKITSSFMVIGADGSKTNLGLSLKFEAKGMKVLEYTRKEGRTWEFSDKALQLIRDYKFKFPEIFDGLSHGNDDMPRAADIFKGNDPEMRLREAKAWLLKQGVRDLDPVPLSSDQLSKETVVEIEKLADELNKNKVPSAFKKAVVKGIPRQAVLLPAHAQYRLQAQSFSLGDRVTMVQETGGVPLSAKGVVISLGNNAIDVVWDVPFMSGTTLQDRCSPYRGSTVSFSSCLNLSRRQYVMSTNNKAQQAASRQNFAPRGRGGQSNHSPRPDSQLRPQQFSNSAPMKIITNPNRVPQTSSQPSSAAASSPVTLYNAAPRGRHTPSSSVHAHPFQDPAVVSVSRGGTPPRRGPFGGRGAFAGAGQSTRGGLDAEASSPEHNAPSPSRGGFRGRDFVPRGRGGARGRGRGRGAPPAAIV